MASESRARGWEPRNGSTSSAYHCRHCGGVLDALGFHYKCHVCGATYCFVHMRRHDRAHPSRPVEVLSA